MMPNQEIPGGFVAASAEVGERTIPYFESGEGDVLLVIHGGSGCVGNLSPVHAELAHDHRVVALELPGFGSTSGAGITSLHDLAGVVHDFAAALSIDRCSLLATSIGSAVALWLAIDHPELVDKQVLEAPAAFREGVPPPGPPPGAAPGPEPAHMTFMKSILGPATDLGLVAAMPQCQVPTLVLFGHDDQLFPSRFAADYKLLPAATVAVVYSAGHDIKGSRPDAYLATVSDFLARGEGFVVGDTSTLIFS